MGDCVCVHPAEGSGCRPWFTCVTVFSLPSCYLATSTHIRARGKGLTHITSLADRTPSLGNTRMHKRIILNYVDRVRVMSVDIGDKYVTVIRNDLRRRVGPGRNSHRCRLDTTAIRSSLGTQSCNI